MSRKDTPAEELPKPRSYLDYLFVRLVHAVPAAPPRARTLESFQGKEYLFFVERGWFCIECRKTGIVLDVPPSQVLVAQRVSPVKEVAES